MSAHGTFDLIGSVLAVFFALFAGAVALLISGAIRQFARATRYLTGKLVDPRDWVTDVAWYVLMLGMAGFAFAVAIRFLYTAVTGGSL